jgi:hypothetical protein
MMDMEDLLELKKMFTQNGILLCFNGTLSHSLIEELGNAAKSYLNQKSADAGVITDVFSVYIEQIQNVRNYILTHELANTPLDSGVIKISSVGDDYSVSSGNYLLTADHNALKERLQQLNRMDKTELKKLYKAQLRKEPEPGSRGAGVGLIDMARKAMTGLDYAFHPIDERSEFFTLNVTVKGV